MSIPKEMLVDMFRDNSANPKVKWDIYGECLWGYFFTDPDENKLARAAQALEEQVYRIVGLLHPDDDDATTFLHVERVETHTPDSLHARNQQLYAFAEEHQLDSYDGMEWGRPKDESLVSKPATSLTSP